MSSKAVLMASLPASKRKELSKSQTDQQLLDRLYRWEFWARPNQLPPVGNWRYWLLQGGRGSGKTRTGAETLRKWVKQGYNRIHLVAPTAADARDVMVQGPGGLLSVFPPQQRPVYEPSKRLVTFSNGATAHTFSADEPERLRGPQCEAAWCDELAAWRFGEEAWDNLLFGLRLGADPRCVITTTPKPIKLVKDIIAGVYGPTIVTRASSYENRYWLAQAFFESIVKKYEGTRLGRQELMAELLEDIPGALWTQALIDKHRIAFKDVLWDQVVRIVIPIDPAVTSGEEANETGIVPVALTRSGHVLVLDDLTCKDSPAGWANIAVMALRKWKADRIIGEINNGGDLVERNIRTVDPNVPFRAVRASRGKAVRAEPVAALYEQGRVHHVGFFPELEQQMCNFVPGMEDQEDDRMDALVWGITEFLDPEEASYSHRIAEFEHISRI